jgi:hypothetical protein
MTSIDRLARKGRLADASAEVLAYRHTNWSVKLFFGAHDRVVALLPVRAPSIFLAAVQSWVLTRALRSGDGAVNGLARSWFAMNYLNNSK